MRHDAEIKKKKKKITRTMEETAGTRKGIEIF